MPLFCLKKNTGKPDAKLTRNTTDHDKRGIAKCYLDVAVNSPHPVRDIEDLRFPLSLAAVDCSDRFIFVDHEVNAHWLKIHSDGIAGPDYPDGP